MLLLSLLCGILSIASFLYEILYITRTKQLKIISFVRLMYTFVYGILPCIYYAFEANSINAVASAKNTLLSAIVLACAIIGYFFLNLGYRFRIRSYSSNIKRDKLKACTENDFFQSSALSFSNEKFLLLSVCLLAIGMISLYLWTKSYGSIYDFIQNAAKIRMGAGKENTLAFFKHFAKLTNITTPIFFLFTYIETIKRRRINLFFIAISVISAIGSILFMFCSDSRTDFLFVVMSILLPLAEFHAIRKKKQITSQLVWIFGLVVVAFMVTTVASDIMDVFRYDTAYVTDGNGIADTIIAEFNHIIRSQRKSLEMLFSDNYKCWLINDILNALFAWIPTRFVPIKLPMTLWTYNTFLVAGTTNTGTLPTDIITASFYLFGVFGPVLLPLLFGWITKWVENKINSLENRLYALILKYTVAMKFVWAVAYYQLFSVFYENTYLFFTIACVYVVSKITFSKLKKVRIKLL